MSGITEQEKAFVRELKTTDPKSHAAIVEACQIFEARCVRVTTNDEKNEEVLS